MGVSWTVLSAALLFSACSDEDEPDARVIVHFDAAGIDAVVEEPDAETATDAGPSDAPPPTFGATVSVQEVALLGPTAEPIPQFGTGGNITVSFTERGLPNVDFISTGTSTEPCTATLYDSGAGKPAPPILNEGTVKITLGNSTAKIPDCNFSNGAYACVGAMGTMGTGAEVTATVWTLTDTSPASLLSADDVGRYLVLLPSRAAFPILGFADTPPRLNLGGPVQATVNAFITVAGAGPIPATFNPGGAAGPPPEFLADNSTVTVELVPGGDNDVPAFTSMAVDAGDAWLLDAASKAVLTEGVLVHTGNVTIGCDAAGSHCGVATGTVIAIDSTDAPTTGATDFPAPMAKTANITCTKLGTAPVVLSSAMIDLLKDASPTRIRISIFRIGADLGLLLGRGVQIVAGQGFVKFEDAP